MTPLKALNLIRNRTAGLRHGNRAVDSCAISLIIVVAAIFCLRFLIAGLPSQNDAEDHVMYLYHFSRQFLGGDIYPRWLSGANKGYGSPIFFEQYPFPYFVAVLLRPFLSFVSRDTLEAHELGIYCFLMVAGAGMGAYYWFRHYARPVASVTSAIAYISLPYFLGMVLYHRVAIGELATFVWMPILLALCHRVSTGRLHVLAAIAVTFALLVMSNILTAVIFVPFLIFYALANGSRVAALVLSGLVLGVCLGAVYVFPAVAYQGLFTPAAFVLHRPFAQLGRNFLFVSLSDLARRHIGIPTLMGTLFVICFIVYEIQRSGATIKDRFILLLIVGLGAILLIPNVGPHLVALSGLIISGYDTWQSQSMSLLFSALLTLGLGSVAYCRIIIGQAQSKGRVLFAIASCVFVLMLPWSGLIWKVMPRTDIIQFPWRMFAILTVAVAGLFALAVDDCLRQRSSEERRRPSLRALLSIAVAGVFIGAIIWLPTLNVGTPRIDLAGWVDPMYFAYVPSSKLSTFSNLLGTSPDTYDVVPTPVHPTINAEYVSGNGSVSITPISPERLFVSAQCESAARIVVTQLYFPLWKIVPAVPSTVHREWLSSSEDDLMEVSLTSGQHDFWLVFGGGLPQRMGSIVSEISILVILTPVLIVAFKKGMLRRDAKVLPRSH